MIRIEMQLNPQYTPDVEPCLIETENGIEITNVINPHCADDIKKLYLRVTPGSFEERVKLLRDLKSKNKRFKDYSNPDVKLTLFEE